MVDSKDTIYLFLIQILFHNFILRCYILGMIKGVQYGKYDINPPISMFKLDQIHLTHYKIVVIAPK